MAEIIQSKARGVMKGIRAMEPGDTISFPVEWMDTVRVQVSRARLKFWPKEWVSRVDSVARLIYVDRIQ